MRMLFVERRGPPRQTSSWVIAGCAASIALTPLFAGCGGSSSPPKRTAAGPNAAGLKSESPAAYQKRVNALVVRVKTDLRAYETARSSAALLAAIQTLKEATAGAATELSSAKPPKNARAVNVRLVSTLRQMQRHFGRAVAGATVNKGEAAAAARREDDLDKELGQVLTGTSY
jgi:hypothetical protein